MSTTARVNKQIQALAVNSKLLTTIINENDQKAEKKKESQSQTLQTKTPNGLYSPKEVYFDSMLQLTSFILYNKEPDGEAHSGPQQESVFDMSQQDLRELSDFAKELDMIESDLTDITNLMRSYKESHRIYCENLLSLIDQKDLLMDLFLDYYNEYYKRPSKLPKTGRRTKKRHQKRPVVLFAKPTLSPALMVEDESKPAPVYVYSVPTENRFSILAKNKSATLMKRFS